MLDSYEGSNTVVIVRVVSLEKAQRAERLGDPGYKNGIRSTTTLVEKVFKGPMKVGQQLIISQGGGADCRWTFREEDMGEQFLFYLHTHADLPVTYASTCGRSRRLDYAADDLLYLNDLEKLQGKTRISGTLSFYQSSPVEGGEQVYRTFPGTKIRIQSRDKTYEATTNRDGVYEIYDLPPGIYEVHPEIPIGLKLGRFGVKPSYIRDDVENALKKKTPAAERKPFEVVLQAKSHAYVDFRFEVDSRIRGTVVDNMGNPLDRVCLKLLPAHEKAAQGFYKADCTEHGGAFQIEDIPAGAYVLVINDDGEISSDEPFPTFFYPGTTDREKATVLTIANGDLIEGLVVNVPQMEPTIVVEGVLLYSDGKPVSSEAVQFITDGAEEDNDDDPMTQTDAAGRFKIRILKGKKGILFGSMYTYSGEFENCPKLEKLIKEAEDDVPEVKTKKIAVTTERDLSNIVLKFPFPGCKKAP